MIRMPPKIPPSRLPRDSNGAKFLFSQWRNYLLRHTEVTQESVRFICGVRVTQSVVRECVGNSFNDPIKTPRHEFAWWLRCVDSPNDDAAKYAGIQATLISLSNDVSW